MKELISHAELLELLSCDPATGVLTWRHEQANARRSQNAGKRAGTDMQSGYRKIGIKQRIYMEHRIIWFYVHAEWPAIIDHINRQRNDNRIANLRVADNGLNCRNRMTASATNRTGLLGAHTGPNGIFRSSIRANGRTYFLGEFGSAQDAHNAYMAAKAVYHADAMKVPT